MMKYPVILPDKETIKAWTKEEVFDWALDYQAILMGPLLTYLDLTGDKTAVYAGLVNIIAKTLTVAENEIGKDLLDDVITLYFGDPLTIHHIP